jgi:hypothetical protein
MRAESEDDIDLIESDLHELVKDVLTGLKAGTVRPKTLGTFRLAYEHVRQILATRRRRLDAGKRQAIRLIE